MHHAHKTILAIAACAFPLYSACQKTSEKRDKQDEPNHSRCGSILTFAWYSGRLDVNTEASLSLGVWRYTFAAGKRGLYQKTQIMSLQEQQIAKLNKNTNDMNQRGSN